MPEPLNSLLLAGIKQSGIHQNPDAVRTVEEKDHTNSDSDPGAPDLILSDVQTGPTLGTDHASQSPSPNFHLQRTTMTAISQIWFLLPVRAFL
jgi:hypothetical protein